jgi:hypothetical protein
MTLIKLRLHLDNNDSNNTHYLSLMVEQVINSQQVTLLLVTYGQGMLLRMIHI